MCSLLIIFANSLDTDQNQQNISPDLDPNHVSLFLCSCKNFLETLILKIKADIKKMSLQPRNYQVSKVLFMNSNLEI